MKNKIIEEQIRAAEQFQALQADRTKLLADLAAMREAGNKMRRELGKLCEMQLADGMLNSAKKSGSAIAAWDALTPPRNG